MNLRMRSCCACLVLLLPIVVWAQGKGKGAAPWDENRRAGIVHVENSLDKDLFGTGAIVRSLSDQYYVITATHNLITPPREPGPPAHQCVALPDGLKLRRGNAGGPELRARCVHHLRSDISAIALYSPAERYPTITLAPRAVETGMAVYLAGFPGGVLDYTRHGEITSTEGEQGMAIANITTTWGLSGAPYAAADGAVIGFHRGAPRHAPGFPHLVPVWRIQRDLEEVLGSLERISARESSTPPPPPPTMSKGPKPPPLLPVNP